LEQIYLGFANELGKWSFLDEGVLVLLNCNVELIDQMVWLEYGSSLRQVASEDAQNLVAVIR
jgi:hypothetical protein